MKEQRNCNMWLWIIKTHLSQSVTVSLSGCRDNNRLSPVLAADVFQVFLNGLQPGQLCREVNRRNAWVVAVAVQLFLQGLVDFIQRAQEELRKRRQGGVTLACPKKVQFICEKNCVHLNTLYCCRVTCPLWKLSIISVFSALAWLSFVTFLICSDRSLQRKRES